MSFFVGRNQKGRVGTLLCCVDTVVVIVVTVVIIDTVVVTECCDTWDEVDSIAVSLFGWSKQIQYKAAPNSIRRQGKQAELICSPYFMIVLTILSPLPPQAGE